MRKDLWRKGLVVGIIVLFIGASVVLGFSINDKDKDRNIIYVNWDGSGDYTTIQEGINAANPGDTVFVFNGTYYENVVVDKTINLTGEEINNTIIDGNNSEDVVYVSADWVNITGFTIRNSGSDWDVAGIDIRSDYNTIAGNNISNNYKGIRLYNSGRNTILNNNITMNQCNGIFIRYSGSSNNIISNNNIHSNGESGVWLHEMSNNNTITNNIIYLNNECGLYITYCANNTLTENTLYTQNNNGIYLGCTNNNKIHNNNISINYDGINFYHSNNNSIQNNNIDSNNRHGINLLCPYSNNNTINNNTVISNNWNGITLSSSNNTFNNNFVISNNLKGITLTSSANNNIIYNNYFSNFNDVYDEGNNTWNISKTLGVNVIGGPYLGGNYWSTYTGFDINGDGIGDAYLPFNIKNNILNGGDWLPLVEPNTFTLFGRFKYYITGEDEDFQLIKKDGTPIQPNEIPALYGTTDGMTIYDNGTDVCSWEYAAQKGFSKPIRPIYQNLSDEAGWPNIHVTPGTVAIDPRLGRFMFARGDDDPLQLVGSTWTGFGVPGCGFIDVKDDYAYMPAGEGDFQVIDISNLSDPQVVGHCPGSSGIAVAYGNYSYIDKDGISAVDVSDPSDPQLVGIGIWQPPELEGQIPRVRSIEIRDDGLAFVSVAADPGFYVLNLSDPLDPIEMSNTSINDTEGGTWVFLSGDRAYVGLQSAGGLLTDPMSFFPHGPREGGCAVIDISDPSNLTLLGTYNGLPMDPVPESGLLALYTFEGDANDTSGKGNHGILYGPTASSGYEGGAYYFDGEEDHIWIPVDIRPSVYSQITMGAWVNASSIDRNRGLISSGANSRHIGLDNGYGSDIRWAAWAGNNTWVRPPLLPEYEPPTDEWVFLAVVYDQENETVTLYQDEYVFSGNGTVDDGFNSIYIGATAREDNLTGYAFNGSVDNVFIFGTALNADQIACIRENGTQGIYQVDNTTVSLKNPLPEEGKLWYLRKLIGVSGDVAIMSSKWWWYTPINPATLILVDVTDPSNPIERGSYAFQYDLIIEPYTVLFSAVVNNQYVYVSDTNYDYTAIAISSYYGMVYGTLYTFNISDPDHPYIVTRYDQPMSRFRHLTLSNNTLFINDYNYGLRILNLSNPINPTLIGGTITASEGHFVWVNEERTYAYQSQTFGGSIYTIDIQNSSNPQKKGAYWDGEWNIDERFIGIDDYLYEPTYVGISILNVSNPEEPIKVSEFPSIYKSSAIDLFYDYAYVLTGNSWASNAPWRRYLHIYNISQPENPVLKGELDLSTSCWRIFAQGKYVYITSEDTLRIVDVEDPESPQITGILEDPRLSIYISGHRGGGRTWVRDGYAYILTGEWGTDRLFHIVDVSDPQNPNYIKNFSYSGPDNVQDIIISGNYLYLGVYSGNLVVLYIADPLNPAYIEDAYSLPLEGWYNGWALGSLSGEYLIFPSLSHLHIVDVPTDNQGLIGPVTAKAELNLTPSANFTWSPFSPSTIDIIQFIDQSFDLDGEIVNWTWYFDDGNISYEQNPSYSYLDNGTYNVTLIITDDSGKTNSTCRQILLLNVPPVANFTYTVEDKMVIFNASLSCDFDGTIILYEWNFDDGENGSGMIIDHTFEDYGIYNVTLTVTDDDGYEGNITEAVILMDTILPYITDNTQGAGFTSDEFTFNATVADNVNVSSVWVEYWYGAGIHTNLSMTNVADDYWEKTIIVDDTLETLHYILAANDTYGNWNNTGVKDITIFDNDNPMITDVTLTTSDPIDTVIGWENFSCTVIDNSAVDEVKLVITGDITTEYPMTKDGDDYYCNITISTADEYTYHIWANDTSNNFAESASDMFDLPLNEDVDMSGKVHFMDLVAVSLRYNDEGPPGWIREDVDNGGKVHFMDLVAVSVAYNEEW